MKNCYGCRADVADYEASRLADEYDALVGAAVHPEKTSYVHCQPGRTSQTLGDGRIVLCRQCIENDLAQMA